MLPDSCNWIVLLQNIKFQICCMFFRHSLLLLYYIFIIILMSEYTRTSPLLVFRYRRYLNRRGCLSVRLSVCLSVCLFYKTFWKFSKKVNATSTWRQAGTRFSCTSGPSELRVLMGVLTTHAQSVNGGPRYTYTPVPPTSVSCLSYPFFAFWFEDSLLPKIEEIILIYC